MTEFHFKIKFYEHDGAYIDRDGFTIRGKDVDDPEYERDLAYDDAHELAEEMLEQYDAYEYELKLEDVS